MSADNWRVCPKCLVEYQRKFEENLTYSLQETLREDYELGIKSDGTFFVDYRSGCTACDFSFSFKHTANTLEKSSS